MIIVQIDIPIVDIKMDFMVDENSRVGILKDEISQVLSQKFGDEFLQEEIKCDFELYLKSLELKLSDDETLASHDVKDGYELLFV